MQLLRYGRAGLIGTVLMTMGFLGLRSLRESEAGDSAPVAEMRLEAAPAPQVASSAVQAAEVASAPMQTGEVQWDISPVRNARVEYWINFLKGRNRERTRLWLERMGRYGPYIRSRLRARGMPEDLVYLALIESGFSPVARSRASAVGLWQFMAATGRRYGLEVSRYVDERRDPIRATEAALDYLQELHGRFGSWYLAAAAYNSGEGRVERALRRYAGGRRGDDALFWRIDGHLPRETRNYVPLMLAAAHIAKQPERYGFGRIARQAPLRFETVRVPGTTSLRAVARATAVDEAVIRDLNPHLLRAMTPPGRAWRVRVPVGRESDFVTNFSRLGPEERPAVALHRVRSGETLSHIARRYGTTVTALRAANRGIRPRRLRVGEQIRIPTRGASPSISMSAEAARWRVHRVRRGDSLWAIARRYGVTVRQLQIWNRLARRSRIIPGQRLRIRF